MNPQPTQSDTPQATDYPTLEVRVTRFFADYLWFILKNAIGWLLMLASLVIGPAVPGPGGIPLFLIGFALVTFPGKRKLTARVLRGKRMNLHSPVFTALAAAIAVFLPALTTWFVLANHPNWAGSLSNLGPPFVAGFLLALAALSWLAARLAFRASDWILRHSPPIRRRVRPWLRRRGISLLPPRRSRRPQAQAGPPPPLNDEILAFHERHHHRVHYLWNLARPWVRRAIILLFIAAIFISMFRSIPRQWPLVHHRVLQISWLRFIIAAGLLSLLLFLFRANSWRWVLKGFGHPLPLAPAARIWSASELARYVPGPIWHILGRIYLVRPYGVAPLLSSISQILEIAIFVLANILLAAACLLWHTGAIAAQSRPWLFAPMFAIPILLLLLHPAIFHPLLNGVLRRLAKPPLRQRLPGSWMIALVFWAILGLLCQALALWILVGPLLDLNLTSWWILAGAYSLAWTAGLATAWFAPAGIGARELVFVITINFLIPPQLRADFRSPQAFSLFLAFLAVLLRLCTTAGELLLAIVAHIADYRGAIGLTVTATDADSSSV